MNVAAITVTDGKYRDGVRNGRIQTSPGCAGYWRIGTIGVSRQSS
jgi:hypothetical protein